MEWTLGALLHQMLLEGPSGGGGGARAPHAHHAHEPSAAAGGAASAPSPLLALLAVAAAAGALHVVRRMFCAPARSPRAVDKDWRDKDWA